MADSQAPSIVQDIVFNQKWAESFGNSGMLIALLIGWLEKKACNCQFQEASFLNMENPAVA